MHIAGQRWSVCLPWTHLKCEGEWLLKNRPVCPLSVLSNWEKQINDHVAFGRLSSYTYHGAGKGVTSATLANYDVRFCLITVSASS